MSFEVQTSLYHDPVAYTFRVTAKYEMDSTEKSIIHFKGQYLGKMSDLEAYKSTL